jgi:hypothetical protein
MRKGLTLYKYRRSKRGFGPTSVILCHNLVDAVGYVDTKCVLKAKLLRVPKITRSNYYQYAKRFSPRVQFIHECLGTVTAD